MDEATDRSANQPFHVPHYHRETNRLVLVSLWQCGLSSLPLNHIKGFGVRQQSYVKKVEERIDVREPSTGIHGMSVEKRPEAKKKYYCKACRFAKLSEHRTELYCTVHKKFRKASAGIGHCTKYQRKYRYKNRRKYPWK